MACDPRKKNYEISPQSIILAIAQLGQWGAIGGRLGWDSLSGLQRAHAGFWEAFRNTGNNSIF